jgi:hypothetical protein
MMHTNRCGNGCQNFGQNSPQFPAGSCQYHGIILKLKPDVREWINLRGCCTYLSPVTIQKEKTESEEAYQDRIALEASLESLTGHGD